MLTKERKSTKCIRSQIPSQLAECGSLSDSVSFFSRPRAFLLGAPALTGPRCKQIFSPYAQHLSLSTFFFSEQRISNKNPPDQKSTDQQIFGADKPKTAL